MLASCLVAEGEQGTPASTNEFGNPVYTSKILLVPGHKSDQKYRPTWSSSPFFSKWKIFVKHSGKRQPPRHITLWTETKNSKFSTTNIFPVEGFPFWRNPSFGAPVASRDSLVSLSPQSQRRCGPISSAQAESALQWPGTTEDKTELLKPYFFKKRKIKACCSLQWTKEC